MYSRHLNRRQSADREAPTARARNLTTNTVVELRGRLRDASAVTTVLPDPLADVHEILGQMECGAALSIETLARLLDEFGLLFDRLPPSDTKQQLERTQQHLRSELVSVKAKLHPPSVSVRSVG